MIGKRVRRRLTMSIPEDNKICPIVTNEETKDKSDAWFWDEFLEEVEKPHPLEKTLAEYSKKTTNEGRKG
jgi:hypothetical protein